MIPFTFVSKLSVGSNLFKIQLPNDVKKIITICAQYDNFLLPISATKGSDYQVDAQLNMNKDTKILTIDLYATGTWNNNYSFSGIVFYE